jgi:hypothetical protein
VVYFKNFKRGRPVGYLHLFSSIPRSGGEAPDDKLLKILTRKCKNITRYQHDHQEKRKSEQLLHNLVKGLTKIRTHRAMNNDRKTPQKFPTQIAKTGGRE